MMLENRKLGDSVKRVLKKFPQDFIILRTFDFYNNKNK